MALQLCRIEVVLREPELFLELALWVCQPTLESHWVRDGSDRTRCCGNNHGSVLPCTSRLLSWSQLNMTIQEWTTSATVEYLYGVFGPSAVQLGWVHRVAREMGQVSLCDSLYCPFCLSIWLGVVRATCDVVKPILLCKLFHLPVVIVRSIVTHHQLLGSRDEQILPSLKWLHQQLLLR